MNSLTTRDVGDDHHGRSLPGAQVQGHRPAQQGVHRPTPADAAATDDHESCPDVVGQLRQHGRRIPQQALHPYIQRTAPASAPASASSMNSAHNARTRASTSATSGAGASSISAAVSASTGAIICVPSSRTPSTTREGSQYATISGTLKARHKATASDRTRTGAVGVNPTTTGPRCVTVAIPTPTPQRRLPRWPGEWPRCTPQQQPPHAPAPTATSPPWPC